MFESLVANVLNKFLGDFVDNLEQKQLNIGIWSGDVTLSNLRLKREALDRFNLPVDVKEGHLGSLVLKIPWSNLKGEPVRVFIKDVYLLATPRVYTTYDPKEHEAREQNAKMNRLETAEMLKPKTSSTDHEEELKNASFVSQLVTKVVDNLQISINNIHIRYEDEVSNPGHRFAVGITLHKLSAQSTDGQWNEAFIDQPSGAIHKLCKLDCLAVYLNTETETLAGVQHAVDTYMALIAKEPQAKQRHQYILKPVSGVGKVILNRNFSAELPKTNATLLFDELAFVLDDEQYRDALLCLNFFHYSIRRQQYCQYRPPTDTSPKTHPRLWLRFAADSILREIHERHSRWTWAHFAQRRDERKAYVRLFVESQLNAQWFQGSDDAAELAELERKLSYEDIRFYRSIARARLRKEKAYQERLRRQQEEQQRLKQQQKGGWFSGWWGGGAANASQSGASTPAPVEPILSEEEMKALYDTIDFDDQVSLFDIPKESILLALNAALKRGSITLRYSPHSGDKDLVSVVFDTFTANLIKRPENLTTSLALANFFISDNTTPNTLYPHLARVQDTAKRNMLSEPTPAPFSPLSEHMIEDDAFRAVQLKDEPLLYLQFENKPLDERADNALKLQMRNIEFIYNRSAMEVLERFFRPPTPALESINALIEAAGDTIEIFKEKTLASFEFALEEHQTMDVQIDIDAPIFILPESCTDPDCNVAVIDSGHIKVTSALAGKSRKEEIKAIRGRKATAEELQRLELLMYDRFDVELSSVQVLVGQSVEKCLEIVRTPDSNDVRHVLNRVSVSFVVETSILPDAFDMPAIKVGGRLPLLQLNFSDRKYRTLMNIVDLISPPEEEGAKPEGIVFRRSPNIDRVLALGLRKELLLEGPSDDTSDQDGEQDESDDDTFYDAEDRPLVGERKLLRLASKIQIKLSFDVERVVVMLRRSDPSNSLNETLLAELALQQFNLNFIKKSFEMNVDVALRSLTISDMLHQQDGGAPVHMLSSGLDTDGDGDGDDDQGQMLVKANFTRVMPTSPDFIEKYEGVDQSLSVVLSRLNVLVESRSILTLQDFLMATFDSESAKSSKKYPRSPAAAGEDAASSQGVLPPTRGIERKSSLKTKVMADLRAVVLTFADERRPIAVASFEDIHTALLLADDSMRVAARLGDLKVTGAPTSNSEPQAKLLEITGRELVNLRFESYSELQPDYPGYDTSIYLRTGALKFTLIDHVIRDLVVFGSRFTQMQTLFDSARQAAAESAAQLQDRAKNMHMDVSIMSPIVVFPCEADNITSANVMRAHLGELSLKNEFLPDEHSPAGNGKLDMMRLRLKSIMIESEFNLGAAEVQHLRIMEDVHVSIDVTRCEHVPGLDRPEILVVSSISDVHVQLTQKQYEEAMKLMQRITAMAERDQSAAMGAISPSTVQQRLEATPYAALGRETHQAIEQMNERQATVRAASEERPWSTVDVAFSINTVRLELFTGDGTATPTLAEASLSQFSLNDMELKFCTRSDDSLDLELTIRSFVVLDSRTSSANHFREVVPAIDSEYHQFMIRVSKLPGDVGMLVEATVDSPKVILVPDYLFALRDFALSGVSQLQSEPSKAPTPQAVTASTPTARFGFRVNIVDVEIILLANPERAQTEAIVLSSKQFTLAQQNVLTLGITKIGMVLCRMDSRAETTLRLVDEFDVVFTLDSRNAPTGEPSTAISIYVQPLVFRASYRDIMMMLGVANKVRELAERATVPFEMPDADRLLASRSPTSGDSSALAMQRSTSETGTAAVTSRTMGAPVARSGTTVGSTAASGRILAREQLTLELDGFQLVLIGDITEVAILDLHMHKSIVNVDDWSSAMKVNAAIPIHASFFNLKNSHWEPVIEKWTLNTQVSRQAGTEQSVTVKLNASERLEFNLSQELVSTMLHMTKDWQSTDVASFSRDAYSPYLIRNRTGYNIHLWTDTYKNNSETEIRQLADNEETVWDFDDWRTRREHMEVTSSTLGIQLEGASWESVRDIAVDREGIFVHRLRPRVDEVAHRIVCEVTLKDTIKVVTFRSSLIVENTTTIPLEVAIVNNRGQISGQVHQIAPHEYYSVPIEAAYHGRIRVRNFGYAWSTQAIHWREFTAARPPTLLSCESSQQGQPPFHFAIFGKYDDKDLSARDYPSMTLRVGAPFELENLLPYEIRCRLVDNHTRLSYSNSIAKGNSSPIHLIQSRRVLLLGIDILETDYKPSEFAVIDTSDPDDIDLDTSIFVTDSEGLRLQLQLNRVEIPESGGAFRVSVFSPYVMLNRTGLELMFKTKSLFQSAQFASGQGRADLELADYTAKPFMFAYPKNEPRNRALVKMTGTNWSSSVSLEAVGSVSELTLDSPNGTERAHVGMEVQEGNGKYHFTKYVTFTPRYMITNTLDVGLMIREPTDTNHITLAAGQRVPLIFFRRDVTKQLTLRFQGLGNPWSSPFNIGELGKIFVRMYQASGEMELVSVDVFMDKATIFVQLRRVTGQWPYRIDNQSDVPVTVYQQPPEVVADARASAGTASAQPPSARRYTIAPHDSLDYAWDYPSLPGKLLVLNVNHRERDVSLQEIGPSTPFKYPTAQGQGIMSIDVVASGRTQVLKLTNFNPARSMFRQVKHGSTTEGFELVNVDTTVSFRLRVNIAGIGVSVINRHVEEIVYATLRNLEVHFSDSPIQQAVRVTCQWLQIDNQKFGAIHPIVLYPTSTPPNASQAVEQHPTFQLAVVRSKDMSHGVEYIKYCSLLLQEISVKVDEDFLYSLIDFANFDTATDSTRQQVIPTEEANLEIAEPLAMKSTDHIYFEVLHIQPIQVNLSFVRAEKLAVEQDPTAMASSNNPLTFLVHVLTMAIGSISDAPIQLNALLMENLNTTPPLLVELLTKYYQQEATYQIHKIVGSADFLGNPVGLFNNISSGVVDIFYEPYQGFIMSDRPQDLGIGLVKGTASFLKKTVFGVSDSLSKMTDTLGKGLTAATFDKAFQDRRRIAKARNRPRHAISGISQGATSLATSFASGLAGVVSQPLAGAESEGVGGFFKGVGRGLVGVVAKPMVGVVDLATNVTEGIRNTTTVFDDNEIERVRLPRHTHQDRILRNYDAREAAGQHMLRNADDGTYAGDTYMAHIDLREDCQTILLTNARIMSIDSKNVRINWSVSFSELSNVQMTDHGAVHLYLADNRSGPSFTVTTAAGIESLHDFKQRLDEVRMYWTRQHRQSISDD